MKLELALERRVADHLQHVAVGEQAVGVGPQLEETVDHALAITDRNALMVLSGHGGLGWEHRGAQRVLATASDIAEWLSPLRPDVVLVRNGVRLEDWSRPEGSAVPEDLAAARRSSVVVYYHGILGDPWFDWNLWEACCRERPEWAFVVVGWPRGESREDLEDRVRRIPNCHYLGPKPYAQLPAYLNACDVAAIPRCQPCRSGALMSHLSYCCW